MMRPCEDVEHHLIEKNGKKLMIQVVSWRVTSINFNIDLSFVFAK